MKVHLLRWARVELLLGAWRVALWTPPDRRVLDEVILPHLARAPGFERVLFVGVKRYNAKNTKLFAGRAYATIDPELAFAPFGGSPHIVAGLEDLSNHVDEASFDAVVVNGVFGHGLNRPGDVERAIEACHRALRPEGLLVLGLNEDTPTAIAWEAVRAMARFEAVAFPPLGTAVHVVATPLREGTHTFRFYRRHHAKLNSAEREP